MDQVTREIESLNPEQRRAVIHHHGPALVLAGAGSGKTRVVTLRIAHLIRQQVPPEKILGVTFTNKAAGEMRERVQRLVRSYVGISTFHSLGLKILKESITHLGYEPQFLVYDEDDTEKILKQCIKELNVPNLKGEGKGARSFISRCKNRLLRPQDVTETMLQSDIEKIYLKAFELYQQKMRCYNALDYDDLLLLPVILFREFPDVLRAYRHRWHFLLIDEYQDTNHAQYTLVRQLVEPSNNVFAVGDPDQSIYSWRGANVQNILNFERDFPGASLVYLEQNYRSTQNILRSANALIQNNASRYEKKLWSAHEEGEKVMVHIAQSERQEAEFVVDAISQLKRSKNIPYREMAVFYRTNFQSRSFEDQLIQRRIPYIVVGGVSFYQRKEIKDILAFLKLTQNPQDFLSVQRTINLPKRGIGEATLEKLAMLSEQAQRPLSDYLIECANNDALSSLPLRLSERQKSGLKEYATILQDIRRIASSEGLSDVVRKVILRVRYLDVLNEDPESKEERQLNLDEFVVKAIEWEETHPEASISQFLEEISLISTLDDTADQEERISLMTIHNGKGLEFEAVFLVGLEEDLFPHINAKHATDDIEEERRLFYVGLTRAKKFAFLTASGYRNTWGALRRMLPSRFISELPLELRKRLPGKLRFESDDFKEADEVEHCIPESTFYQAASVKKAETVELLSIGDVVHHPEFGVGQIKKVDDSSLGKAYSIVFLKDMKERKLVAKYAPLSVLKA